MDTPTSAGGVTGLTRGEPDEARRRVRAPHRLPSKAALRPARAAAPTAWKLGECNNK
jgi:hypothetical protein